MTLARFFEMLDGTQMTIALTLLSIFCGIFLALLLAFMRMSTNSLLKTISWAYVWIVRGTPLYLQIIIVHFMVPIIYTSITGGLIRFNMFVSGVVSLTLNTSAYVSEIIRAGIESIDKGQMEAAKALGMSKRTAMTKVIIPQTLKRIVPPFSNEFTMILKDSSLVATIGFTELSKVARSLASSGNYWFLFYAAGIYLFLTTLSSFLFDKLEKYAGRYE